MNKKGVIIGVIVVAIIAGVAASFFFYLGSRGIEPSLAKRLLCIGFITECIDGPLADELRGELLRHVDS